MSSVLLLLITFVSCVTGCYYGEFQCNNGQCVPISYRCNGFIGECSDESDELHCASCRSGASRCTSGQCIRSSGLCDGTPDCSDGSDETGCAHFSGDLRLVQNGFTNSSLTRGRLEVFYSGQWGTVCDDYWSSTNTRVACRQLGFTGSNTSWTTSSAAGYGILYVSTPIWLDNVRCSGTESGLTNCSRNIYGHDNCHHFEDVAIDCNSGCDSTQFQCSNGQCVSSAFRCNGRINGCSDGSDEINCTSCQGGAVQCSNGQCIPSFRHCDGIQHCTNGSDEIGCASCQTGAFRCNNRQCIRSSGRCDGTRDCTDGSDETGCPSSGDLRLVQNGLTNSSYTSGRLEVFYRGLWGTVCYDFWSLTNTRVACRQLGFSTSNTSWSTSSAGGYGLATGTIWLNNVRCSGTESRLISCSKSFYHIYHNCDHYKDVAIDCNSSGCDSTQFQCSNGQCVSSAFRCNGRINGCSDGSDEINCTSCQGGAVQCSNGQCIPSFRHCDGIQHCTNGSDEIGCASCQTGAFRCNNRQCIRSSGRCDGTRDCTDGSDETGCPCNHRQFRCTSGRCISTYLQCDGFRTCSDGSDERNCILCRTGAFRCNNRQCIHSSGRCDGTRDCTDGSDETGCPISGDLRLVKNGRTSTFYTSGRLEVYYSRQWGTVCNDAWTTANTEVACRQLGISFTSTRFSTSSAASFGSTNRQIWLDNVKCSGTESRLVSCSRNPYGSHNCDHSKDVAIYCNTPRPNTGSDTNYNTGSGVHLSASDIKKIVGAAVSVGGCVVSIIIGILIGLLRLCSSLRDTHTTTAQPDTPTTTTGGSQDNLAAETKVKQALPSSRENSTESPPPSYEMSVYPPQTSCPSPPQES